LIVGHPSVTHLRNFFSLRALAARSLPDGRCGGSFRDGRTRTTTNARSAGGARQRRDCGCGCGCGGRVLVRALDQTSVFAAVCMGIGIGAGILASGHPIVGVSGSAGEFVALAASGAAIARIPEADGVLDEALARAGHALLGRDSRLVPRQRRRRLVQFQRAVADGWAANGSDITPAVTSFDEGHAIACPSSKDMTRDIPNISVYEGLSPWKHCLSAASVLELSDCGHTWRINTT